MCVRFDRREDETLDETLVLKMYALCSMRQPWFTVERKVRTWMSLCCVALDLK